VAVVTCTCFPRIIMRQFATARLLRLLASAPLALLALVAPRPAHAVLPTIVGTPTVANPYTPANTMMYNVTVTVSGAYDDPDHNVRVGFAADGTDCTTGTWKMSHVERFATTTTKTFTLYNFQPGSTYDYKVQVGNGPYTTACGVLGTPSLPANLGYLTFSWGGAGGYTTKYVMLDTDDCGGGGGGTATQYLVALDTTSQKIVWYLDPQAVGTSGATTFEGWRYQAGNNPPATAHVEAILNRRYLYDWNLNGVPLDSKDYGIACTHASGSAGPCASHDLFKSQDTGHG
jgi:hypothetical protein